MNCKHEFKVLQEASVSINKFGSKETEPTLLQCKTCNNLYKYERGKLVSVKIE